MARSMMTAKITNTQQSTERGSRRNGGNVGDGDGDSEDDNRQGRQQWARMVTTTGEDDINGKDIDSKDNGNNGKDDQQGW